MNEPKKHHFVPEVLLKNFTDENNWLYFYDRRFKRNEVCRQKPSEIFYKKHLNTYRESIEGLPKYDLEEKYSKIETNIEPVFKKIFEKVRSDNLPEFTSNELSALVKFIYAQYRRVPDLHEEYYTDQNFNNVVLEEFEQIPEEHPHKEEIKKIHKKIMTEEIYRNFFKQKVKVKSQQISTGKVEKFLRSRGIVYAFINNKNKSFIIGSRPVLMMHAISQHHDHENQNEIWLPLSSDIALCFAPIIKQKSFIFEMSDNRDIRYFNETIYNQSNIIASRSNRLVASISRTKKWSLN